MIEATAPHVVEDEADSRPREPSAWMRLAWGLLTSAAIAVGYALAYRANPRFFFQDDSDGGGAGLWTDIGTWLRAGEMPFLVPGQWMAGNYAVEGQVGLFSPPMLLVSYLAPAFDDAAQFITVVKLLSAIVLGTGVYRTSLAYGAIPAWAAAAGIAMPFTGFALYYDSITWASSLFALAWIPHAWASMVRYSCGHSGPFGGLVYLYLALSVGYVHAAVMAGVLVAVLAGGELVLGRARTAMRLCLIGVAPALVAAITYLPGLLSAHVTWRGNLDDFARNDGFLSSPWSESLAMSLPSALPAVPGFGGPVQLAPITYVAWFVLPLLAYVDWPGVARHAKRLVVPLAMAGLSLVVTAGPSDVGPLRWPARLLPYLAMSVLILVAVFASRHLTTSSWWTRLAVAAGLVLLNVVRASSANPDLTVRHVETAALVMTAFFVVALGLRYRREVWAASVVSVVTLSAVGLMVHWYPNNRNVNDWNFPAQRSVASAAFPAYEGSTLQLGDYRLLAPGDKTLAGAWSELSFGNYARFIRRDYVNAYSPVGFRRFSELLCMDYAGSTCPEAYSKLFSAESTTGRPYADLLALDRVVLQRAQFPQVPTASPPEGWEVARETDRVIVLERTAPRVDLGRVVDTTGVEIVGEVESTRQGDRLLVRAPDGGRLVFARLAWPGYEATVDGTPVTVESLDDMLVSVVVPARGDIAELRLEYRPPGHRLGLILALAGVLLACLVVVDWRRGSARRAHDPTGV